MMARHYREPRYRLSSPLFVHADPILTEQPALHPYQLSEQVCLLLFCLPFVPVFLPLFFPLSVPASLLLSFQPCLLFHLLFFLLSERVFPLLSYLPSVPVFLLPSFQLFALALRFLPPNRLLFPPGHRV